MIDPKDHGLLVNPTVVATPMPEGAVLIDSTTGECFELNRTGARVWECLQRGEAIVSIVDSLAADYAVERSIITSDIATLVEDLARHGMLAPSR